MLPSARACGPSDATRRTIIRPGSGAMNSIPCDSLHSDYCCEQTAPVFTQASSSAAACALRAGSGLTPGARRPGSSPPDDRCRYDARMSSSERAAIARGILDLLADLGPTVLPSQPMSRGARCQIGSPGTRAWIEIRLLMTDRTAQRRKAEAVGFAFDRAVDAGAGCRPGAGGDRRPDGSSDSADGCRTLATSVNIGRRSRFRGDR